MKRYCVGYTLAVAGLFALPSLQSQDTNKCPCQGKPPKRVLVASTPFSDSIAEYVVSEIIGQKPANSVKDSLNTSVIDDAAKKKSFLVTQEYPTQELLDLLEKELVSVVYIARDPRSHLIAAAEWLLQESEYAVHKDISLDQLLAELITLQDTKEAIFGPKELLDRYNAWKNNSKVYIACYEKLAGERSLEEQILEISKIATHIDHVISMEKAAQIAKKVSEKVSITKGKDNNWKELFTQEHKELFKQVTGSLLVDLGYEKDASNW